jgi:hypothetical protein
MTDWLRAPLLDKRIAHGDEFAGDAWRHRITGEIRYVAVGELPGDDGTVIAVGGEPGASAGKSE